MVNHDTGSYTVDLIPDQVFSRVGGHERLADVYRPRGLGRAPVVLFLHGGGWRIGDRRLGPDLARFFAGRGLAMVSIDYRLSDEAIFPAALIDTLTAIRWIRAHAGHYGFNADRIGLWGSSAGGHLAALAALVDDDKYLTDEWSGVSTAVQAVVDGYGPTDFIALEHAKDEMATQSSQDAESAALRSVETPPGEASFEALFLGGRASIVQDQARAANPITHVAGPVCPFLITHGVADEVVPPSQSEKLFAALAEQGGACELVLVDGLSHGFFNHNDLDDRGDLYNVYVQTAHAPDQTRRSIAVFDYVHKFLIRTLASA